MSQAKYFQDATCIMKKSCLENRINAIYNIIVINYLWTLQTFISKSILIEYLWITSLFLKDAEKFISMLNSHYRLQVFSSWFIYRALFIYLLIQKIFIRPYYVPGTHHYQCWYLPSWGLWGKLNKKNKQNTLWYKLQKNLKTLYCNKE